MAQASRTELEVTMLPTGALAVEASAEFGREDFIPSEIAQAVREGGPVHRRGIESKASQLKGAYYS